MVNADDAAVAAVAAAPVVSRNADDDAAAVASPADNAAAAASARDAAATPPTPPAADGGNAAAGGEGGEKRDYRSERWVKRRADAAKVAQMNSSVKADKILSERERMRYLISQSKPFQHFLGASAEKVAEQERHRMTEAEEDAIMMQDENEKDDEHEITRLSAQPSNVRGQMRDYQIEGLNFLVGLHERGLNGILADEMGLGKTLQTISLLAFLRLFKNIRGPHLVIVPKGTLGNWEKEFAQWCPDIRVVRFHGDQQHRAALREDVVRHAAFDVCLTSYEMVAKEKGTLARITWRYLIIDEAHRIKNENSILSQLVRTFESQNRLLITGTPLQNNLRELWALLNFLLPDVFASADDFDSWFSSVGQTTTNSTTAGGAGGGDGAAVPGGDGNDDDAAAQRELVQQLHSVLRPFLIRRLKADVERALPPKKETVLYLRLTPPQQQIYRNVLKRDVDAINGSGGDRVRLLNILMQLRKCCNHPYLFDGAEDRTLDPFGEHLVEASAKLRFLDKLLPRLKADGHRVLIFCQMTRVLDILEDYCCARMRGYEYCRIDGSTDGESRERQIEDFNAPNSDKFVFLLSTRAGGLGINLASADTVILYDSDWNPQVDLQAMDRAHRIGQRRPVNVYRLVSEKTVEERILRKALEKLQLDSLVIQSGHLAQHGRAKKSPNTQKEELLDMIRFGADSFFKFSSEEFEDVDLDVILSRGAQRTAEMNTEIQKMATGVDRMELKLGGPGPSTVYEYDGVDYAGSRNAASSTFFLDVGKRGVRNKLLEDGGSYRETLRAPPAAPRPKARLRAAREPTLSEWHFVDSARVHELFEEERRRADEYNAACERALAEGREEPPAPEHLLDDEQRAERERLLSDGFLDWHKRDYFTFLKAIERHGRRDLSSVVEAMRGLKDAREVKEYAEAFWTLGPTKLDSWPKIERQIEEGEARIARSKQIERTLRIKTSRYDDEFRELDVPYAGNHAKQFSEDEDRWLVCTVARMGYGQWEELKAEIRASAEFRFNWFIKSRTLLELRRRVDILVRLIEKENEELAAAERTAARKAKAVAAAASSGGKAAEAADGGVAKVSGAARKHKAKEPKEKPTAEAEAAETTAVEDDGGAAGGGAKVAASSAAKARRKPTSSAARSKSKPDKTIKKAAKPAKAKAKAAAAASGDAAKAKADRKSTMAKKTRRSAAAPAKTRKSENKAKAKTAAANKRKRSSSTPADSKKSRKKKT